MRNAENWEIGKQIISERGGIRLPFTSPFNFHSGAQRQPFAGGPAWRSDVRISNSAFLPSVCSVFRGLNFCAFCGHPSIAAAPAIRRRSDRKSVV